MCVHCSHGEAKYCEKCYQDLISQNVKLQMENINLCNDINSRGYWPANPMKKYHDPRDGYVDPKILTNDFYDKNSQFAEQCNEIKEVLNDGNNGERKEDC